MYLDSLPEFIVFLEGILQQVSEDAWPRLVIIVRNKVMHLIGWAKASLLLFGIPISELLAHSFCSIGGKY